MIYDYNPFLSLDLDVKTLSIQLLATTVILRIGLIISG